MSISSLRHFASYFAHGFRFIVQGVTFLPSVSSPLKCCYIFQVSFKPFFSPSIYLHYATLICFSFLLYNGRFGISNDFPLPLILDLGMLVTPFFFIFNTLEIPISCYLPFLLELSYCQTFPTLTSFFASSSCSSTFSNPFSFCSGTFSNPFLFMCCLSSFSVYHG